MNISVSGGLDDILSIVRKRVDETWNDLRGANEEAAEFGAKTAQSYTASRPGATTGKAGRIASGDMIGAIRSQPVSFSDSLIVSRYGFVDEFEEYFRYQTVTGFSHNRSGDRIQPTFALRDSIGPTRDYAVRAGNAVT